MLIQAQVTNQPVQFTFLTSTLQKTNPEDRNVSRTCTRSCHLGHIVQKNLRQKLIKLSIKNQSAPKFCSTFRKIQLEVQECSFKSTFCTFTTRSIESSLRILSVGTIQMFSTQSKQKRFEKELYRKLMHVNSSFSAFRNRKLLCSIKKSQ